MTCSNDFSRSASPATSVATTDSLFSRQIPNLDKPEPKGVFTAENAENAEKNKEENLCALCVNGHCLPILRSVVKFLFFVPGLDC